MRFLRMLVGYLLASFGAAMALGMFALSPNSIEGFFDKLPEVVEGAWGVSPYLTGAVALLGAVPAVLAFQYAEANSIRSWVYYELVGAAVAIGLYWLAHGTETVPLKAEGNIYSTIAVGVAGAVLGLAVLAVLGPLCRHGRHDRHEHPPRCAVGDVWQARQQQ